jgi:hypothetical protein
MVANKFEQTIKDPTILDKAMSETTNQRYGCVASVFSCDYAYVILVSQLITHWWFSSKFLSKKQGGKLGAHVLTFLLFPPFFLFADLVLTITFVCCLNRQYDGD